MTHLEIDTNMEVNMSNAQYEKRAEYFAENWEYIVPQFVASHEHNKALGKLWDEVCYEARQGYEVGQYLSKAETSKVIRFMIENYNNSFVITLLNKVEELWIEAMPDGPEYEAEDYEG